MHVVLALTDVQVRICDTHFCVCVCLFVFVCALALVCVFADCVHVDGVRVCM